LDGLTGLLLVSLGVIALAMMLNMASAVLAFTLLSKLFPGRLKRQRVLVAASVLPLGGVMILVVMMSTPLGVDDNGPQIVGGLILGALLIFIIPASFWSGRYAILRTAYGNKE
jgi:hypothetical protein